ncbi:molybdate ABC transporter substrate-binding protein [Phaeobacter sp. CAU 1743]|uniref:molybdate ABC transporter substrate-binding protein n=1 Tax=Phaeobacter sp. CAU 1743 TaxID=3140367 RepID=UPI0023B63F63
MILSRTRRLCLAAVLGFAFAIAAPGLTFAGEVTVFAASSLTNAIERIRAGFEAETGHAVEVSLAGSSVLARQIEYGAPADVFISANPAWMDHLEQRGRIVTGSRFDLMGNSLVLIAHGQQQPVTLSPDFDLAGLLGENRLAMALIEAVPAGIYGKAALSSLGLWDGIAPNVAQTDNVRAALALVATGEAPFGIVYATDAKASADVSIIATFPRESHPPIIYPAAAIAPGDNPAARDFLDYLQSPAAGAILTAEGFTVMPE